MKRTLFALALLVPAFASAAVKLDVEGDVSSSLVFTQSDAVQSIKCKELRTIEFTLVKETAEEASFTIIVKDGEKDVCESDATFKYDETQAFECPEENVQASISIKASQMPVAATAATE